MLQPGIDVDVILSTGDRASGNYARLEENAIVLNAAGGEVILPRSQVRLIHRDAATKDSLRNGSLIGAAAGAAAGMGAMYGFERGVNSSGSRWSPWREENLIYMIGGGLVGAGIGAAIGALLDSRIKQREVLYRAP